MGVKLLLRNKPVHWAPRTPSSRYRTTLRGSKQQSLLPVAFVPSFSLLSPACSYLGRIFHMATQTLGSCADARGSLKAREMLHACLTLHTMHQHMLDFSDLLQSLQQEALLFFHPSIQAHKTQFAGTVWLWSRQAERARLALLSDLSESHTGWMKAVIRLGVYAGQKEMAIGYTQ